MEVFMKKLILTALFAVLLLPLGRNLSNAQPQYCSGDPNCTANWEGPISVQCTARVNNEDCLYNVYYYHRDCPGFIEIEIVEVGNPSGCLASWNNMQILQNALRCVILDLGIGNGTVIKYGQSSCWRKEDYSPLIPGSFTMVPCNPECCKYTITVTCCPYSYTIDNIEFPQVNCQDYGSNCQPVCFEYLPSRKGSYENSNSGYEIFPNPTLNSTTIRILNVEGGNYSLYIYSLDGKLLRAQIMDDIKEGSEINFTISLDRFIAGNYIFIIEKDSKIFKQGNVIIQK
jgi:hypothetical protein